MKIFSCKSISIFGHVARFSGMEVVTNNSPFYAMPTYHAYPQVHFTHVHQCMYFFNCSSLPYPLYAIYFCLYDLYLFIFCLYTCTRFVFLIFEGTSVGVSPIAHTIIICIGITRKCLTHTDFHLKTTQKDIHTHLYHSLQDPGKDLYGTFFITTKSFSLGPTRDVEKFSRRK